MAMSPKTRAQVEQAPTLDPSSLVQLTGELTGEYQRCRSQALTPEVVAELSELVGAIETISKELAARKSQELDERVAALDREVAQAVEEGNSEVPTPAVAQPPPPADLNEQLAALDSRVGAVSDATPPVAQTGWRSWRQRIGPRGQPGGTGNARLAVLVS